MTARKKNNSIRNKWNAQRLQKLPVIYLHLFTGCLTLKVLVTTVDALRHF